MPPAAVADAGDLVDLERYPLGDQDGPLGRAVVATGRRALADRGVCELEGFLRPAAVARLAAECDELAPLGHHAVGSATPYLGRPEEAYPEGHPRRHLERSSLAAVAYDLLPEGSALRALYEWDPLLDLVARLLDAPALYRYADPFGALNLAVMRAGDELGWHFDFTDVVVSLAVQSSLAGGAFEAVPFVRATGDERYDEVAAVVAGASPERVVTLAMVPGTLVLFAGRHSLHRVTPVVGDMPRYVGLLSYDTAPGTDSTDALKLHRYGRLP